MRRIVVAVVAVVAGALMLGVGVLVMPRPPHLAAATSGAPELIERVQQLTDGQVRDRMSVAVIDGDEIEVAHFGADGDTVYEIGSVTKTITGALYAEALDRGEVTATTTLGELLDVDGAAADVTLQSLATQSSGLPRLPSDPAFLAASLLANVTASDPYAGADLPAILRHASAAAVGEPGYEYSNLGMALLGQALAAAAGQSYADLASSRVFGPLGMDDSGMPLDSDGAPSGFTAGGRSADPWTMAAYAPAGAARSTLDDLVLYAQALLDGTAPGAAALDPVADLDDGEQIGYAWFVTDRMTWHNGMTGGFASFVGMDRAAGTAVVILSNTAVDVDALALELLP